MRADDRADIRHADVSVGELFEHGLTQLLHVVRAVAVADDDQLLERACAVFDGLLARFRRAGCAFPN